MGAVLERAFGIRLPDRVESTRMILHISVKDTTDQAWKILPMLFDYKWEQMKVSATKVETPVWEMTIWIWSTLEYQLPIIC